jgi:SWI/SNF-related matrix-associated actin-dependent regulator 1 of chromatin subfamily A
MYVDFYCSFLATGRIQNFFQASYKHFYRCRSTHKGCGTETVSTVSYLQVDYRNNVFIAVCSFAERETARARGFKWQPEAKVWYTESLRVAASLREYATPAAKRKISERLIDVSPWTEPLPSTTAEFLPHQLEALPFVLGRSASYLALEPGLGKTPVAAAAAQALAWREGGLFACVYVTPPFLVKNVAREFKRWAPWLRVTVLNSKTCDQDFASFHVLILPDTFLSAPWTPLAVEAFTRGMPTTFLIVDEAHRFKNDTAQRTVALYGKRPGKGLGALFTRKLSMSGTPMPNRPMELYTNLAAFAPEVIDFRTKVEYGERYCAGVLTDLGWDFSGESNMDELREKLKLYMLTMKKDRLDLPPKIEQVFLLSADMPPEVRPLDQDVAKALKGNDTMREKLATMSGTDAEDMGQVSVYRRVLGEFKARDVIPYLKSILEETHEALIVFAYHRQAIATLAKGLKAYEPFVITGDTSAVKKDAQVTEFQASRTRRLFIGNYLAMGVGFPMQRADRVVFVEFSWVPGENGQASDRPHRIGRVNPVLVQYVTYQGSLDEAVLRTNLAKMKTINKLF